MKGPDGHMETLIAELAKRPDIYMVGIAGIPGSGKTTLAQSIASHCHGSVIVGMDGYHIPRCRLDTEGLRRRGAAFTFDDKRFHADMTLLRQNRCGVFPAFDHAEKDPKVGAIRVTAEAPLVIIEGLYVLCSDWNCEGLFDLRVFLDCDLDQAIERLVRRHLETGVAATAEEGRLRAMTSDRLNAEAILADGCRERADLVLQDNYLDKPNQLPIQARTASD
jgi:pantothenate kinase